MKVLTVIVTYNALRHDWISKCLDSLMSSTYKTDIIVIDNNSTDATTKFIEEKNYPVHLIKSEINLGFGKANNIGLEYALKGDYDFAFLLNQDVYVEVDTLEKLITIATSTPEYGIISPLHLNGDGSKLDWIFSTQIAPKMCDNLVSDSLLAKDTHKIYNAKFISAACWLITQACLTKTGGFNPTFFHYGEDNNYVQRVLFHKYKIGVYPLAKIYHDRQRSPDWSYGEKEYTSMRDYLINLSNPNAPITIEAGVKHLKTKKLKAFLKRDYKELKQIKKEIQYFKDEKINIEENLRLSIEGTTPFLNI